MNIKFSRSGSAADGFALVVTLTLMVLLSILALGMLSLSSVAIRSAGNSDSNQIARANARMAMLLALGELQTYLGPDARTSARAETLAKDSRIAGSVSPNTPKAWWVGASHSDGTTKLSPSGKDVQWLISGLSGGDFSGTLSDPIKMIGAGSLDLATFTGGKDIEAGRVPVKNAKSKIIGAYAWFVDDNGMKAQLRPADPNIQNSNPANPSGGVLAASYNPSILTDLSSLTATPQQLQKTGGNMDLEFVGLTRPVIRSKFFGYTPRSQGVLSDTKKGGLKKDLTIAFENPAVFSNVFPTGNTSKYLLITEEKLATASDLKSNGYIHWAIFRDYYNLKKYIKVVSGSPTIQISTFDKEPFLNDSSRASKAPHLLKDSAAMPYGQPTVFAGQEYVNNPIAPLLAHLQENCWLTYEAGKKDANNNNIPAKLITHAQLWTSHYNPYNIAILDFNESGTGPRLMNFPMMAVTIPGYLNRVDTVSNKLQVHAPGQAIIPPGKSQLLGFAKNANLGQDIDDLLYSSSVQNLVTESVKVVHELAGELPSTITFKTEFYSPVASFMIGCDHKGGSLEASQLLFTPFAWDKIPSGGGSINRTTVPVSNPNPGTNGISGDRPGKIISKTLSVPSELNYQNMSSFAMSLRTTNESNSALRPLVDSNIRAQWSNPRWDSPLGLNVVATHSMDFNGVPAEKIPQADTTSPPLGFTFLGSGRTGQDPSRVILFDVPRRDLVSLGQLQHAAAGRFSYEPSYIIGNSYANPRIPLGSWKAQISDTFSATAAGAGFPITAPFNLYDSSYLTNEVLWDSYTFTTIPQQADNFTKPDVVTADMPSLLNRTIQLPNSRYIPYEPAGSKFDQANLQATGNASTGSFFHNAGHLIVDGSFNVNSTSVDAWEAFLSGTAKLPVGKISSNGALAGYENTSAVRFPRVASSLGGKDDYWTGYRELSQTEVREIATETVNQIRKRGPFLTMGQFVNRSLKSDETGKSGTLQAALDATVNKASSSNASNAQTTGAFSNIPTDSSQGAGFPGQLLQGDIFQALAPYMTVRSDTFTIRAYGEAKNPSNGNVTATAWCETVVQRFPDPVTSSGVPKPVLQELAQPSSEFGRKFKIISFRWLHPDEV